MPAGALVIEAETGRLLMANDQARTLLDRPLSASGRESMLDAGSGAGPLIGLLTRALTRGESTHAEVLTLTSRGGEARRVEVSVGPVLGESKPVAAVAVLHDVEALMSTQEELHRAGELRERFVGVLGHDLRNPLNAVTMAAALLQQESLAPAAKANVDRIRRACETMKLLIADLLDLTSARQAGGIPIRKERVDLAEVCTGVVDEVRTAIPSVRVELAAPPVSGEVDRARLAQAVTNLVVNAAKYCREGTPVRIALREEPESAVIEVHNHGDPIDPELLPYLFDAFRRGPQGGSPRAQATGLGLGLYIAQQVVAAHGGQLSATSSREAGTLFRIELPRAHGA